MGWVIICLTKPSKTNWKYSLEIEINFGTTAVATICIMYYLVPSFNYNFLFSKNEKRKCCKTKHNAAILLIIFQPVFSSWLFSQCKVATHALVYEIDKCWHVMTHTQDNKIHTSCDELNRWVFQSCNSISEPSSILHILARSQFVNLKCVKCSFVSKNTTLS